MADRQYELLYILPPDSTEQQVAELHEQIASVVSRLNGQIEKTDNWGRRRLAYEIGPHKEGVYVLELINGSGDLMLVVKPYWYFGSGTSGTSHGAPYAYDTNVPLIMMGKQWIKPGAYGQYAEVVDIAPTLSFLLRVRPPAGAEGRVLTEALR